MAWLRMRDFITLKSKDVLEKHKNVDGDNGRSLLIRVAASHSGTVNGNQRFYRPDRMQDGVKTFVPKVGFKKPVLIGHDESGEVLGRVIEARYVDESYKYAVDYPIVKDSLFYRSDSKKIPLHETVDWIVDNLMDQDDYTGLGYIELGLNITNPAAIDKVMRDEYLTVSVGFKTDSAICSACKTDWAVDDKCDHKLGSEVDGKPVFLISGNFDYEEVSFVNFPADPFAGVISKERLADARSRSFFLGLGRKQQRAAAVSMTDSQLEADIHHVEETDSMTLDINKPESHVQMLAELKADALTAERAQEFKALIQGWAPETDELKTKKRSLQSTLNAVIKKRGFDKKIDAAASEDAKEIAAVLNPDTRSCSAESCECPAPTLDEIVEADRSYFEDEEGLYAELEIEIDAAITAGELSTDSKDKKLSTDARKALKASAFCGPNRSFPVTDSAHVTASRRLIGRAKISEATKSKILDSVSHKAKLLGCGEGSVISKPADGTASTLISTDRVKKVLDKLKLADGYAADALELINKLDSTYDKAEPATQSTIRGTVNALTQEWDGDSWLEFMKSQLKEERDMVVLPATELADMEDAVNKLTEEKTALEVSIKATTDSVSSMLKVYKRGLAQTIVMAKTLSGADGFKDLTSADRTTKIDELSKRHVEYLRDTVADIMSELKWSDSTATIRKETVTEPGLSVSDNAQITDAGAAPSAKEIEDAARAEQVKNLQAIRETLQYMNDKEARLYLATLGYEAVKLTK